MTIKARRRTLGRISRKLSVLEKATSNPMGLTQGEREYYLRKIDALQDKYKRLLAGRPTIYDEWRMKKRLTRVKKRYR